MRGSAAQIAERSALSEFFIGKGAASACPFHRFNHRVAEEVKGAWGAGRQAFRRREPLPEQHKMDACAKDEPIAPPQLSAGDFQTGADLATGASVPPRPAEVSGAIYLTAMRAKMNDLDRQVLSAELPSCGPGPRTEPASAPRPEQHYKEPVIPSVRAEPWFPDTALASPRPQAAIPSQGVIGISGSKNILPPAPALYTPREPAPPAPKPRLPALSEPAGLINGYGHPIGMIDAEAFAKAEARAEALPSQRQPAAAPIGPEPTGRLVIRIARPKQTMPPAAPAKIASERTIRPQKTRKEAPGEGARKRKDSVRRMPRMPASPPAHAPALVSKTKDKATALAKAEKPLERKMNAPRQGSSEKPKTGPVIMREAPALLKKRRRAAASLLSDGKKPVKARPSPASGKKKIKIIRTPSQAPSGAP